MIIRMAKEQAAVREANGYRNFVRRQVEARWPAANVPIFWERVQGVPAAAFVQDSSWVVGCPDCSEHIVAQVGEPLFCPNCCNVQNAGAPRPVIFPPNRGAIEAALLRRPVPATRNWLPGEPVEQLRAENAAHGLKES